MRNITRKNPNAYKHGIYSHIALAPGEDGDEFEALYADLNKEWMPAGETEEDAVLSIAKAIWRKRRVQTFIDVQLTENILNPSHPSYYEEVCLKALIGFLRSEPDVAFKRAAHTLRPKKVAYLKNKFPRSDFNSSEEWANAVINEIISVLMPPTLPKDHPFFQFGELILSAGTFTDDFFDKELKLDERLDLMIDRAVKRLVQTKMMKQMLGQTGGERVVEHQARKNRPEEGCSRMRKS
jgi:hypothetical protein